MKNSIILFIILLAILIGAYKYSIHKNEPQLGEIKLIKPPKVKISFSRKLAVKDRFKISNSSDAYKVLKKVWSSQIEIKEEAVTLFLDINNQVISYQLLSMGGVSGTVMDGRLIYAAAVNCLASSIILAHNHPSGNLKPSQADLNITRKIANAGKTLDIEVLDHLIVTKESYYSLKDEGLL